MPITEEMVEAMTKQLDKRRLAQSERLERMLGLMHISGQEVSDDRIDDLIKALEKNSYVTIQDSNHFD